MSKYFAVQDVRSKCRNFNFINGERSIGKTYSTLKYIIDDCLKKNAEFVYIVRNQNEKKSGCIGTATQKVLMNEFPDIIFDSDNEHLYLCGTDGKDKIIRQRIIGHCIALTEAGKMKKRSFPLVKYIVFDEYMIENSTQRYVNGWNEPDLFLNLYSTIDRDEDRVVCFLLGNNTSFYNPYHLHKAFNIPEPEKGKMWMNKNVLFYWAVPSEELAEEKSKSKFRKMLEGTTYGQYAFHGEYISESDDFVMARPLTTTLRCNLVWRQTTFGVWYSALTGYYYLCWEHNNELPTYCVLNEDFRKGYILCKKGDPWYKNLGSIYATEHLYFADMEIKSRLAELFDLIGGRSTCLL